ncbi:GlxA family transcriptional regulator [Rhizobium oryziradicis]|uniref:AraC family transcriptional regulator n=1 Tax=Rhizobium oryziradicis TaxID=1867956 RepID=A0A1Q8ZR90_9HYPH|nr:GlxA family transcriptional regulator [Rhizobium oryziradicis]OLP44480.1 AraC family transcriptional regulator [Rhizobium oryziradicis]
MTDEAGQPRIIPMIVVVPPNALLLDLAGPMEVLRKANLVQQEVHFSVRYVGASADVISSIGLSLSGIAPLPHTLPPDAMVVISGCADEPLVVDGSPPSPRDTRAEAEIIAWLRDTVQQGTKLITICSGALFAAKAGLLEGYRCTTHHANIADLKKLAPTATVLENRLFVEDQNRLTSAGITTSVDLMLSLIAKEVGHVTALTIARYLVVYLRRAGGDPQLSPWLEGRNHIHPAIHRVQDAVTADPTRPWSVDAMADIAMTSRRTLSRLFNDHTGISVTDYVNRMRMALARELVINSRLDMEAIAERCGFASARQFRRAWNRLYQSPPHLLRRVDEKMG